VEARASGGRVLATLAIPEAARVTPVQPASKVAGSSRPAPHLASSAPPRWPLWSLVATSVASAAAGTALGIAATRDERLAGAAHFASDTATLDARARERAIAANALVGLALLSGGGALLVGLSW
jgi:hypothetical protein